MTDDDKEKIADELRKKGYTFVGIRREGDEVSSTFAIPPTIVNQIKKICPLNYEDGSNHPLMSVMELMLAFSLISFEDNTPKEQTEEELKKRYENSSMRYLLEAFYKLTREYWEAREKYMVDTSNNTIH